MSDTVKILCIYTQREREGEKQKQREKEKKKKRVIEKQKKY